MNDNVGSSERILRVIVGVLVIVAAILAPLPGQWHMVFMSVGLTVLFTAAFAFCPLKALLSPVLGKAS